MYKLALALSSALISACSPPKPPLAYYSSDFRLVNQPKLASCDIDPSSASKNKAKTEAIEDMNTVGMTSPGVLEIGDPDMSAPNVKEAGIERPLSEALRTISPSDWKIKKNHSVSRYMKVSWNKGMDWLTVLNDLAIENHLAISVNWKTREVTVLNKAEPIYEPTPSTGKFRPTEVIQIASTATTSLKQNTNQNIQPYLFVQADCKKKLGIIESGKRPSVIPLVPTSGYELPLKPMLQTVLPVGWHAAANETPDILFSWDGNIPFTDVLTNIAKQNNLSFEIKWNEKKVIASVSCEQIIRPNHGGAERLTEKTTEATKAPISPPVSSGPKPISVQGPLKEATEQVVSRWGYKLEWKIDEAAGKYSLKYPVLIAGKTLDEDLRTLAESVSDKLKLQFDTYANKIVAVTLKGNE